MKVLLTGARGGLGSYITQEAQKYPQIQLINAAHHAVLSEDCVFDITNQTQVNTLVGETKPDVIIHAAALANVDWCQNEPNRTFLVNVEGTRFLAESALRNKIFFVYISTDFVFDGKKGTFYTETDTCHPLNVYGKTKWQAEQIICSLLDEYLIVRPTWLFGRFKTNFVDRILKQIQESNTIEIVKDKVSSPTYCKDLADWVFQLIQLKQKGIFNAVNEGAASWLEMAQEILRLVGKEKQIEINPVTLASRNLAAPRPLYSALSVEKLKQSGIHVRPWQEALKNYLKEDLQLNVI